MRHVWTIALLVLVPLSAAAQTPDAKSLIRQMVANETAAAAHKPLFAYTATERSDRTGGQAWTEHVVETPQGRVRYRTAVDGHPLTAAQQDEERNRLAAIVSDPSSFEARERAEKDDEANARQMMSMLEEGFLLDGPKPDGSNWRIDFKPDPSYSASGTESKVLHGMQGYLLIDRKDVRLKHIEGRMPQDVSVAMGLGSVHAGSRFESDKQFTGGTWRTTRIVSDIHGKALLFKTITRNADVERSNFERLSTPITLAGAVSMAESGKS